MPIYKYLSSERLDVLGKGTLRATQGNALNDPFELRPFFEQVATSEDLEGHMDAAARSEQIIQNVIEQAPSQLKDHITAEGLRDFFNTPQGATMLAAAQQSARNEVLGILHANADRFRQTVYDKLRSIVGIVSFSEVPDNVLMWAHYATEHRGFVVEFNDEHPFFERRRSPEDEFFHLRQVVYVSPMPTYRSLSELDGLRVMCMKRGEWAYERERRFLVPVDPNSHTGTGEPIHLIKFPMDAVRSVIIGSRAAPQTREAITTILGSSADYAHIRLRTAAISERSGDVELSD